MQLPLRKGRLGSCLLSRLTALQRGMTPPVPDEIESTEDSILLRQLGHYVHGWGTLDQETVVELRAVGAQFGRDLSRRDSILALLRDIALVAPHEDPVRACSKDLWPHSPMPVPDIPAPSLGITRSLNERMYALDRGDGCPLSAIGITGSRVICAVPIPTVVLGTLTQQMGEIGCAIRYADGDVPLFPRALAETTCFRPSKSSDAIAISFDVGLGGQIYDVEVALQTVKNVQVVNAQHFEKIAGEAWPLWMGQDDVDTLKRIREIGQHSILPLEWSLPRPRFRRNPNGALTAVPLTSHRFEAWNDFQRVLAMANHVLGLKLTEWGVPVPYGSVSLLTHTDLTLAEHFTLAVDQAFASREFGGVAITFSESQSLQTHSGGYSVCSVFNPLQRVTDFATLQQTVQYLLQGQGGRKVWTADKIRKLCVSASYRQTLARHTESLSDYHWALRSLRGSQRPVEGIVAGVRAETFPHPEAELFLPEVGIVATVPIMDKLDLGRLEQGRVVSATLTAVNPDAYALVLKLREVTDKMGDGPQFLQLWQ